MAEQSATRRLLPVCCPTAKGVGRILAESAVRGLIHTCKVGR